MTGERNKIRKLTECLIPDSAFLVKLVYCFHNCFELLGEKLFLGEGREFVKVLRSLEQFIQTVKGQNNFW